MIFIKFLNNNRIRVIIISDNDEDQKEKKKYIGVWISPETKEKWQEIARKNEISTISKLIRKSIQFYDSSEHVRSMLDNIESIVHELKEPLNSIKGFSQLLLKDEDKLDFEVMLKIKEILNNSNLLEEKIREHLEKYRSEERIIDVLIIDDESSTVKLLTDLFEGYGLKVKGISNGKKAIESLKSITPRLILLDILLPDISGYEVCREIRKREKFKDVPVIYITAVPEIEVIRYMKDTGASNYILKPFNITHFDPLIEDLKKQNA